MKVDLINSIRRLLSITSDHKTYFTRLEIEAIVAAVSPKTHFDTLEYKKALSTTVPGWKTQKTIETHPNVKNLNTIYELLNNQSYKLETLISMIDKELLKQSKSVKLNGNILTIELKV